MSEIILKVGKKGEIFTTKELRKKAKIRVGGKVRVAVKDDKVTIEAVPLIEDLLRSPVLIVGVKKTERLSEKAQRDEGIFG